VDVVCRHAVFAPAWEKRRGAACEPSRQDVTVTDGGEIEQSKRKWVRTGIRRPIEFGDPATRTVAADQRQSPANARAMSASRACY
jgi:hypothetical protein